MNQSPTSHSRFEYSRIRSAGIAFALASSMNRWWITRREIRYPRMMSSIGTPCCSRSLVVIAASALVPGSGALCETSVAMARAVFLPTEARTDVSSTPV